MLVTSICPAPSFATASTISHFLLEMYILVNGACHFNGKAQYCYCSYLLLLMVLAILMAKHSIVIAHTYYSSSSSTFISARYSSRSFCQRAMNEVSKRAA